MRSPIISYSFHNKHRLEVGLIPPAAPAQSLAAGAGTTGRDKHHGTAVAGQDCSQKRKRKRPEPSRSDTSRTKH